MWITRTLYVAFMMVANSMVNAGTIDTSEQEPFEQCGYCHEYDGNSVMPNYPRLAGQQKNYLVKQLLDFKKGKRKGLMQATAELLTEQDINTVATYFSQQTASSANQSGSVAAKSIARKLYLQGDAKRELLACRSCHVQSIVSNSLIPKLVGQHENYLTKQLVLFKNGQRSNDKGGVMRRVAAKLTITEIRMMSKFLSGLAPTKNDNLFAGNVTHNVNKSETKQ